MGPVTVLERGQSPDAVAKAKAAIAAAIATLVAAL